MTDVDLSPALVNLLGIVEHDDWAIALTLTAGGVAYDLTAAVVTAGIKSPSASHTLTTVVTDATHGKMTVSESDAPVLEHGSRWALRINGRTVMSGKVTGSVDVLS